MFEFIAQFFNFFLYFPLFNSLVLIYDYLSWHDFGIAIIILTVVIRLILYPVSVKALKSQRALSSLQPQLQELQKKHKDDKEKQAKETMELYRREKINPFSGLLLALIQLPILIVLYRVFWNGLKPEELSQLYSFVANPGHINTMFLGILDLSKPNLIFAIIAGAIQFVQTKMLMPTTAPGQPKGNDMAAMMQKQMVYFFPFITVVILLRLPSALGLYWIATGIFSIGQQYFLLKNQPK
ncbi:YidC/Oxa1 family membrane protein insertase [Candidatus Parcubacteria bacterium]|nr:YidC/Oxa1 family membrane protein insertase [Candidatus Parcubacteria bacterium]